MSRNNLALVEYVKKFVGSPYWYGMFGQVATEKLLSDKRAQYPGHYGNARMSKYRSQLGKRVFDCIGMVKGYMWTDPAGNVRYNGMEDWNANGTLQRCREKGVISTMPDLPGVLVFFPDHVGIYIGNGEVIEARGFDYGVVKTRLNQRPWRHWGKHPLIQYTDPNQSFLEVNNRLIKDAPVKNVAGRIFVELEGENGRKHWIQIRALSELLNAQLSWDGDTKTAKMFTR